MSLIRQIEESLIVRIALKALAKLTFSSTGMRVDLQNQAVTANIASSQTLATVTTVGQVSQANAVCMGRATPDGQGIQMSQIAFQQGFRRNLTVS